MEIEWKPLLDADLIALLADEQTLQGTFFALSISVTYFQFEHPQRRTKIMAVFFLKY